MVHNLRYYHRRAAREGSLAFEQAHAGNLDKCYAALLHLHAARWNSRHESGVIAPGSVQNAHFESLPQLLAAALNADVAIGSRYVSGGSTPGWPLLRRIISRGGSLYAKLVLGVGINDVTGGFRCCRRTTLEAIDLDSLQVTGFGFQVELNYRCHQRGLKIVEVPITFVDRRVGTSKMSSGIFLEALTMVWKLRFSGGDSTGNRGNGFRSAGK
jgi:dolichol-phosphate mannosyltransferase